MTRTVHSLLWLKKFISEATENTIILCGTQEANAIIFPMCLKEAQDRGVLFWVPYPGMNGATGFEFSNFVLDSSWDRGNLSQYQVDWFEAYVMPYVAVDARVFHAP